MKPLLLHVAFILLSLKNKLRIFPSTEAYEKGGPTCKWSLLEQTTLTPKHIEAVSWSTNKRESLGVGQKCLSSFSELGVEREDLQQYLDLEGAHLDFFIPMIPTVSETNDFQGTRRLRIKSCLFEITAVTSVFFKFFP